MVGWRAGNYTNGSPCIPINFLNELHLVIYSHNLFDFSLSFIFLWILSKQATSLCLQMHIQTLRGQILETILSLRFLIFQYGIVYKLDITGKHTSLAVRLYLLSLDVRHLN